MLKAPFLRVFAVTLCLFMILSCGISTHEKYDVKDPETCKLHFTVLSDSHIEGNNLTRYKVYENVLQDVKKNKSGHDAIVFLGDNTMNGNSTESMLFHGTAELLLKDEKVLPVMGNHDIGNGQGDYEKLQQRWYDYTCAFFGKQLEHPYYCEVIGGCFFIVLATEEHTSNTMEMSADQLEWLRVTLEKAADSGMPVFVFSHHPERASYRIDPAYEYSLTDILTAYAEDHDLFYFSGHTHRTLTRSSFQTYYNFPETSLPCLTKLTGEKDNIIMEETGVGVEVELYENEVVIRGRNFYAGEWAADDDGPLEATYALKAPVAG